MSSDFLDNFSKLQMTERTKFTPQWPPYVASMCFYHEHFFPAACYIKRSSVVNLTTVDIAAPSRTSNG